MRNTDELEERRRERTQFDPSETLSGFLRDLSSGAAEQLAIREAERETAKSLLDSLGTSLAARGFMDIEDKWTSRWTTTDPQINKERLFLIVI